MSTDTSRRRFVGSALRFGTAIALAGCRWAQAQARTDVLRLITGYPPGGSIDLIARRLAERLTGRLARTVVVENRTGAAGRIAVDALKASGTDGTAILITPSSILTMYPHVYRRLSYDVFADLAPVTIVASSAFALVAGPMVPAAVRTFAEFVAWCRANPASATCGNAGAGSFPHFMATLLAREAAIPVHTPYRGGQAAMLAAAGGHVACALSTESSAQALEKGGKLRVLATSGTERSPFLQAAPNFAEVGINALTQNEWFGAFMPARTPQPLVDAASEAIRGVLAEAEIRDAWRKLALSVQSSTPGELSRVLRADNDFWGPVIRASGFTPED